MPRARFFACALCKHSFTLHIPYCERKGCLCRGYVTKKEKILLHEHKFTLDALLTTKTLEVYKADKITPENPNVISPTQTYIVLTKLKTEYGALLWFCQICKKKGTYAKMLKHEHLEKTVKVKKKK